MADKHRRPLWKILGRLAPFLLLGSFLLTLKEPLTSWFEGPKKYDREALYEWIREASVHKTLPELLEEYLQLVQDYRAALQEAQAQANAKQQGGKANGGEDLDLPDPNAKTLDQKEDKYLKKEFEIHTHLEAMLDPVTKIYKGKLPLFPVIYQMKLVFEDDLKLEPFVWDSELPRQEKQCESLSPPLKLQIPVQVGDRKVERKVYVHLLYHLRVYNSREYLQREASARLFQISSLFTIFLCLGVLWYYLYQSRERERQRQRQQAEQQINAAERLRLQEELGRQEAERRREEAERTNLELKSSLWANIGILAGSYAHNIKNLLVRPNDLLARCLEGDGLPTGKEQMLVEVRHTLGTVTERLQQILQTVRRDPTQAERVRIDLNDLTEEMRRTWQDLAQEKWKLTLTAELCEQPLWIEGDRSHLQQAIENLLFNARDATFEMRNYLREQARNPKSEIRNPKSESGAVAGLGTGIAQDRRMALIAAASWNGTVTLRTRLDDGKAVLEVSDNGIGMTEEVRRRCTETHFSTKRNNALYAGFNAGMGLGLSFIRMILEHHKAELVIDSEPFQGTKFYIAFPLAGEKATT